jgi:PAS domain S-box-containing protein
MQTEKQLQELSNYKKAIDDASIVAITNAKGIIVDVNDNFCKISKYSREELIGKDHRIINSGYHPKQFFTELWQTINSGNTWKGDIKNKAKDGSFYWVQTVIVPFTDNEGKPYQFIAIRNDITPLKTSEKRIEVLNETVSSNEQRFFSLIKCSNDIISLLDKDFRTVFQSESAFRITGWNLEDLKSISRFDHVHPDEAHQVQEVCRYASQNPGEACPLLYRKLHKNGQYIWLEGTLSNQLADPSLQGYILNLRDVTGRIKSEEQLASKSREISDMLSRIEDGFITLDKDLRYTYANSRITQITGYPPEYLIGKKVWEVFPDAVGSITYQGIEQAVNTQLYVTNTDYYPPLNLWQENHIYPTTEGVAIFVRDISQKKQAEQELKDLNWRLSFHINNTPLTCIEFDDNFRFKSWSPQAEVVFGWKKEEVIDKQINELDFVYEDDGPVVNDVISKLLNGSLNRNQMINRNRRKDGKVIYCEWHASALRNDTGKTVSVLTFVQDITARIEAAEALQKSEEKYRALIEEAVDGIIVFDPADRKIKNANKRLSEMFGRPASQFTNILIDELTDTDFEVIKAIDEHLKSGGKEQTFERKIGHASGMLIDVEVNVKKMPDDSCMAFLRDITERKKQQEAIRQLNEGLENMVAERTAQLEISNKDLEAFSYSVSHDLRAPLRAVNGYASILEEDFNAVLGSEGKRLLHEVQENAKRMGTLIDDLLTFSRMGRQQINKTLINMNGLCVTAFDEVTDAAKLKVEFILHPLDDAMADFALIKQVLINLLSNAIKYSSKNEKAIVEVSSSKNDVEIIYSIRDNGVGFNMKYAGKLFGVFQRLHSTDEFEGTGVGLATVQRIVSKHGGKVWAKAIENHGATFYFSLPLE